MQARKNFTDKFLDALKPAAAGDRYVRMDGQVEHFGVRVTDKGNRSFFVLKRMPAAFGSTLVRHTIGDYPGVTLKRARELARAAIEMIAEGKVPREVIRAAEAERKAAEEKAAADTKGSFELVAEEFKLRHIAKKKKRTQEEMWRPFRAHFVPKWRGRHVASITRREVSAALDDLVDAGRGVTANRYKTVLSGFFNWAIDKGYVEASPIAHMKDPFEGERARERVLADWELRLIWSAATWIGYPYGDAVKLLLLTAQRRDEVSRMERPELQSLQHKGKAVWLLPAARTKAGRENAVPLSEPARALLSALPVFKKGQQVFSTTNGERPIGGYSKFKARLDRRIAKTIARLNARRAAAGAEPLKMDEWRLHDLRRTASTGMERLGISDTVRKLVLNHSRKAELGVTAIYSHHDYADEKRQALDRWAAHLIGIVEPPKKTNVVRLRAAGA